MRSTNLPLVLRQLRDHGPRSRARLATDLGLTRSAASALVAELESLGLVRAAGVERGGVGRPGTAVELDGRQVCGIGAEINVNHVSTIALDLAGRVVAEHRLSLDSRRMPVGEVLDRLVELLARTDADVNGAGATSVGAVVGVAGLLDREREVLTIGPNLDWFEVPVGAELRSRIGAGYPVSVENEGNLAAIAESLPGDPSRQDILVIFGEFGVGGGIVAGGQLLRGHQGYAGEFGHMIVDPGGRRCGCGRIGCWETVSGLRSLLDAAADPDDTVRNPALSLDDRLAEINRRAGLGDTRTLAALDQVGRWVGVGAAMLTNALNPAAIVLSGYFAALGQHLQPRIQEQLLAGVLAPEAGGTRVEFSTLGFTAAVRGGATVALDAVFNDPTLVAPGVAGAGRNVMTETPTTLLQMTGIVKEFPGVRALDGVDLDVRPGEVHCLLGQNGAGKSTLIKVLSGFHQPDEGTITWDGQQTSFAAPAKAIEHGVSTIYQELDLVPHLDVTENVFLGHELSRVGFTQRVQAHREARELLARLGHADISPTRLVADLPPASQQIVSMARALSHDTRLLVLDEPSAVLDQEGVKNLFRVIRDLTAEGVAVVYISHRLEEIREIGDRITVLKDGRTVATGLAVADTPTADLIKLMTGRSIEYVFPPRPETAPDLGDPILEVRDLSLAGVFSGVDLIVHAGEIVGLAGLVGAGRSEIVETLYGGRRASAGTVSVDGKKLRRGSVASAVRAGVGLAPEERKSQGLLLDEAVFKNITVSSMNRFARLGFLNRGEERRQAQELTTSLDVRPDGVDRAVRTLSGGNQQKVVLARWLLRDCRVLLLDEPTRGVDVGARSEIYQLIRSLADRGVAVVVVSSEIEEVLGMADRVLVVREGQIVHESDASEIDEAMVLDLVMEGKVPA